MQAAQGHAVEVEDAWPFSFVDMLQSLPSFLEQSMKRVIGVFGIAIVLSGCITGITKSSPSMTIETDTTYQEAYRRADAFARECHSGAGGPLLGSFTVSGNLYSDNSTGVVRVQHPSATGDLLRVDIRATSTGSTAVAWVAGIGMWDQRELEALAASMRTGKVGCR